MKHGNKTIQYSIYDRTEGGNPVFITDTTSITRPDVEILSESIKGAGILGELDMPTYGQIGAMSYSIAFKRTNTRAVKLFKQKAIEIETRWVADELDSSNGKVRMVANKEIVKMLPKKIGLGSIEGNSANETTIEASVYYYKYIQDGVTLLEIDKLNNVFIVDGVDYGKEIRDAL